MSKKATLARIDAKAEYDTSDYGIIESAVAETARGRWFLQEYARRNRHADTLVLLESIEKLAVRTKSISEVIDTDRIRLDLKEMAQAIASTRAEIGAIKPQDQHESRLTSASCELDSIVAATEAATSDILEAAEHVQETAWTMREQEIDEKSCEKLDALATDIYTACSFQDITGQRSDKVIKVLQYLENRINGMSLIWGTDNWPPEQHNSAEAAQEIKADAHLLNAPVSDQDNTSQSEIDTVLEETSAAQDLLVSAPEKPKKAKKPKKPEIFEEKSEKTEPKVTKNAEPQPVTEEDIEDDEEEDEAQSTFSSQPAAINMSSLNSDDMHALFCC